MCGFRGHEENGELSLLSLGQHGWWCFCGNGKVGKGRVREWVGFGGW